MIGYYGLPISSVVCSTIGCSGYTGLGDVGIVVVWADEEESLLKIFVLRPRRSYSSSESPMSIISGVGAVGCTGL